MAFLRFVDIFVVVKDTFISFAGDFVGIDKPEWELKLAFSFMLSRSRGPFHVASGYSVLTLLEAWSRRFTTSVTGEEIDHHVQYTSYNQLLRLRHTFRHTGLSLPPYAALLARCTFL